MKKINERAIIRVVIATEISSVVTQLLTIREFLTQFQGNEIVIALILFNWLILNGFNFEFSDAGEMADIPTDQFQIVINSGGRNLYIGIRQDGARRFKLCPNTFAVATS